MFVFPVTSEEIIKTVMSMKNNSLRGYDEIPMGIIKKIHQTDRRYTCSHDLQITHRRNISRTLEDGIGETNLQKWQHRTI